MIFFPISPEMLNDRMPKLLLLLLPPNDLRFTSATEQSSLRRNVNSDNLVRDLGLEILHPLPGKTSAMELFSLTGDKAQYLSHGPVGLSKLACFYSNKRSFQLTPTMILTCFRDVPVLIHLLLIS